MLSFQFVQRVSLPRISWALCAVTAWSIHQSLQPERINGKAVQPHHVADPANLRRCIGERLRKIHQRAYSQDEPTVASEWKAKNVDSGIWASHIRVQMANHF